MPIFPKGERFLLDGLHPRHCFIAISVINLMYGHMVWFFGKYFPRHKNIQDGGNCSQFSFRPLNFWLLRHIPVITEEVFVVNRSSIDYRSVLLPLYTKLPDIRTGDRD